MNLKHIKNALKKAGLRLSDVVIEETRKGHVFIIHNGRKITCSSSPKDPHTATLRIAKELQQ